MRILIVDDSDAKIAEITGALPVGHEVDIAKTLADAARKAEKSKYDLIVLDLMLPFVSGAEPDTRAGLELLIQLREHEGPNRLTRVVGLSSFPTEVASSKQQFDAHGVLVLHFGDDGRWIGALGSFIQEIAATIQEKIICDFVVVVALEEERSAFFNIVDKERSAATNGLNISFVRTEDGLRGAIIRLARMGLLTSTHQTTVALNVLEAPIWAMSGICAGIEGNSVLGQAIFASPAWEYQAGKWSGKGFEIAPLQVDMNAETRNIIDEFINGEFDSTQVDAKASAVSEIRPNNVKRPKLAPMASGSAVIADAERLKHIEVQHRKLAAIDMEASGFFYALRESVGGPGKFFCCKVVVDFADSRKDDNVHEYGAYVSALTTMQTIRRLRAAD